MNILLEDHLEFARKLLDAKVEFILIGGYAVIFHGYVRTTGDMDVWLNPTNENKNKLMLALQKDGVLKEDIESLSRQDFTKHLVFHIGASPTKIDFLTRVSGVTYDEADKQKVFFETNGLKLPVIHYNHLVLSKISSDRAKDKADIEELAKVRARRKD